MESDGKTYLNMSLQIGWPNEGEGSAYELRAQKPILVYEPKPSRRSKSEREGWTSEHQEAMADPAAARNNR